MKTTKNPKTIFDRSFHHLARKQTSPPSLSKKPSASTSSPIKLPCPQCGHPIGNIAGTKEAICPNCGFKDPCCE